MKTIKLYIKGVDMYHNDFVELVKTLQSAIKNKDYEIKIEGLVKVDATIDCIGYGLN